ncbi:MAG TPA: hypothetical protein VN192_02520 [Flavobacterium sp.]|nr:hypothetical protein [Flavobacterium sp.]
MIKLKTEVNKAQLMREIADDANGMYARTYEAELRIKDFVSGAEYILNKLRLPAVMPSVCDHYFAAYKKGDNIWYEHCEFCGEVKHTEA